MSLNTAQFLDQATAAFLALAAEDARLSNADEPEPNPAFENDDLDFAPDEPARVRAFITQVLDEHAPLCRAVCEDAAYAGACHSDSSHWRTVAERFGCDLYFTAMGHGTGFWDRKFDPENAQAGEALSEALRKGGAWIESPYVGDDGALHFMELVARRPAYRGAQHAPR